MDSGPRRSREAGIELPRWIEPLVEGLVGSYFASDFTEQGPEALSYMLLGAFADLLLAELGPGVGAIRGLADAAVDEESPLAIALATALADGYAGDEGPWLRDGADEDWLLAQFSRTLSLRYIDPPPLELPSILGPRLERAVGAVLAELQGTAEEPEIAASAIVRVLEQQAVSLRLGALKERLEACEEELPPLSQILCRRLQHLTTSGGTWLSTAADGARALEAVLRVLGATFTKEARASGATVLLDTKDARAYHPEERFARGDTVAHADFGVGVVIAASPTIIEVAFPAARKKLVHGRTSV